MPITTRGMVGVAGSVRRGGAWRGSRSQDDVRQGERRKPSCPVLLKKVLPSTSVAKACIDLFVWRLAQPRDGGCSTSSRQGLLFNPRVCRLYSAWCLRRHGKHVPRCAWSTGAADDVSRLRFCRQRRLRNCPRDVVGALRERNSTRPIICMLLRCTSGCALSTKKQDAQNAVSAVTAVMKLCD